MVELLVNKVKVILCSLWSIQLVVSELVIQLWLLSKRVEHNFIFVFTLLENIWFDQSLKIYCELFKINIFENVALKFH